jgi:dipeptidyl aminopeptidase/acylaminoacyl peptidase
VTTLLVRISIRLVRALLTAATLAALAPAGALGSFPGGDGVIAYPNEGHIWALEPKTGDQLQLTSGPEDRAPSFSASGNMLAFQRGTAHAEVFLARADGSDAMPLVSGSEPAFSPDNRQIVFVRATGLFTTGLVPGSPVRRITDHRGDSEPRWSATGVLIFERIEISRTRHRGVTERQVSSRLEVVVPPSSHVRTVMTYEQPRHTGLSQRETELHPDWSPNGRTVAVALCNDATPARPPFPTVPALVFHGSCSPDVWEPEGRRLAEPKRGTLQGRPQTTCPHFIGEDTEISWQPLLSGTLHVPVVKCEPRPGPPENFVEPAQAAPGSRTCYYDPHRHRRRCFRA